MNNCVVVAVSLNITQEVGHRGWGSAVEQLHLHGAFTGDNAHLAVKGIGIGKDLSQIERLSNGTGIHGNIGHWCLNIGGGIGRGESLFECCQSRNGSMAGLTALVSRSAPPPET